MTVSVSTPTSSAAIAIRGLGKRYRIGEQFRPSAVRDKLANPRELFRRSAPARSIWALRDVSLDIRHGSVVGLIGRNGAGKSTLLKILSRITEPTEGEARLYGRVASLLEVGTGFHMELTGRENVFLNGSILGMSREQIRRNYDAIVDFADIGELIDTPVKRYSSGMFVRLAFAIAAHVDPEILLIDEVLSVGDAAFQNKCLGKVASMTGSGRTVVIVSHNMDTISRLCDTAVWLARGEIKDQGPTVSVVRRYLSEGTANATTWSPDDDTNPAFIYHSVSARRADGLDGDDAFPADLGFELVFDFTVREQIPPGRLSFRIDGEDGRAVLTTSDTDRGATSNAPWTLGRQRLRCVVPAHLLAPGRYYLTLSEPLRAGNRLHESVIRITISEQGSLVARDGRDGVVAPLLAWTQDGRP
ncbi:MAG: ATP-binding cassette domain-containing protein [Acidobacteria bacterium]|nr:ATP-binding cassette domain-containing protein [Acidobacteriota bacterium]MBV9477494.1 ATP-binding cassette domain-containing protein [Acidobacteriota bacterium]